MERAVRLRQGHGETTLQGSRGAQRAVCGLAAPAGALSDSSLSISSVHAASVDPAAIANETDGSEKPAVNRKPARMGASTDPPRPTPIAKPVPEARTCVGKACAMMAYRPTMPALMQKPASAQII